MQRALVGIVAVWLAAGPAGAVDKPLVVATTTMIADLAMRLAAGRFEVAGIMRTGEDPHVYEPRPADALLLRRARVLLRNGLHLEGTLVKIIENNLPADALNVALGDSPKITPLESQQYHGAPDPHCWFNVKHFKVFAENTLDAFIKADPAGASAFRKAAATYLKELDALDRFARTELAKIPKARRVLITSHDAFQYLGQAYGIEVHAVIGISTEQEPRPQDVEALVKLVQERKVKAVFIETSVSPTLNALVQRVSERTGVRVGGTLYSDSLGPADGPAGSYLGMVRHNVRTITAALK